MKIAVAAIGPALIAGLVLLAAWWKHRLAPGFTEQGEPGDPIAKGGEPFWLMIALPGALVPSLHLWVTGAKAFPPVGASQWVPLVVIGFGFVEFVLQLVRAKPLVRHSVRLLALAAAGYVCARNFLRASEASVGESITTVGIFALCATAMAWATEAVASRTRGLAGPLVLVVTIGAATQLIGLGMSNLFISLSLTGAASILGAACVVSLLRRRFSLAFGGTFVPISTLAIVTFITFLSNAPDPSTDEPSRRWIYCGAILASTILPALILLPPFHRTQGKSRAFILLSLAGLPMTIALAILGYDQLTAKNSDTEYDYSLVAPITAGPTPPSHSAP